MTEKKSSTYDILYLLLWTDVCGVCGRKHDEKIFKPRPHSGPIIDPKDWVYVKLDF